jgi:RES domain-containing protein
VTGPSQPAPKRVTAARCLTSAELLRRLAQLPFASIDRHGWRHVGPARNPRSGEGARALGGRFNAPDSFPGIYVALRPAVCGAEFFRLAAAQNMPPADLLPRFVFRFTLHSDRVLDLRDPGVRASLELEADQVTDANRGQAQLLGELARGLGFDIILSPSATGAGDIAVIFQGGPADEHLHPELVSSWFQLRDVPGWHNHAQADDAGVA